MMKFKSFQSKSDTQTSLLGTGFELNRKAQALSDRIIKELPALTNEFILQGNGDLFVTEVAYQQHPREYNYLRQRALDELGHAHLETVTAARFTELQIAEGRSTERGEVPQFIEGSESDADVAVPFNNRAIAILTEGVNRGSSDIYIDLVGDNAKLSYRTNGLKEVTQGVLTRDEALDALRSIWARSGKNQFEETEPSNASFDYLGHRFRCSSLPAVKDGQGVVLRMRDPNFHLPLNVCGYSERQIEAINACAESPGGLFLLTGETNSGKSSTLASLMFELPTTQKIIEVSDPIEVEFEHVTQIEIKLHGEDATEHFDKVLGELVRQNPDTLILGEIRDRQTAKAASSMALQGKRVLSTLHTQRCILAFPRMYDLGIEPDLLYQPGFVAGIINQNLVPRLCPDCKLKEPATDKGKKGVLDRHNKVFGGRQYYSSGVSCGNPKCRTGVIGQTLVAEVYPMALDKNGHFLSAIRQGETLAEIEGKVREAWGMERKHEHAYSKIVAGEIATLHTEQIIGRISPDHASYPERREII